MVKGMGKEKRKGKGKENGEDVKKLLPRSARYDTYL